MDKILLFNRWDTGEVKVEDLGLKSYINLTPTIIPKSSGRYSNLSFQKSRINVVERFMNKLMVPGHRGKKHKITSGHMVGNTVNLYNHIIKAFEEIEKSTGKNPVLVLVKAIENSSPIEEVASYRMGGIIARNAVVITPQRRIDIALRYLTQGIYKSGFKNRKPLHSVIAEELIAAYSNDPKSFAVSERNRLEKEAEGAR
ncbi:MAG: 30S ribosomal protein S7 [Candidatus Thorarchaeota archaeon]|jgi:small subunit ribosomal protein S7